MREFFIFYTIIKEHFRGIIFTVFAVLTVLTGQCVVAWETPLDVTMADCYKRVMGISLINSVCNQTPATEMSVMLLRCTWNEIFKNAFLPFHFWRQIRLLSFTCD